MILQIIAHESFPIFFTFYKILSNPSPSIKYFLQVRNALCLCSGVVNITA
jgi:hypothetical protein